MKNVPLIVSAALVAAGALGALAVSASAAEVRGRVTNGTTGQPVAGQFINLLVLRGQMIPVRETQTDNEGRYRIVVAANPSERFLVQVPFQGVNYNRPAFFTSGERITADIEVFETGAQADELSFESHVIFFEPHEGHVRVSEFYSVNNRSRPRRTYAPEEGSFHFAVPAAASGLQAAAGRPGGMPLRQQPQPGEEDNSHVLSFAFKPGESEVQISYSLPLSGNTLEVNLPIRIPTARRHIAIPNAGVELQGAGVKEIEQDQAPQARVFAVDASPPAELALRLSVDPAALENTSVTPAGPAAQTSQSVVNIVANPVNRSQWYIVGLALVVLAFGLYYLSTLRPPAPATDAADSQPESGAHD